MDDRTKSLVVANNIQLSELPNLQTKLYASESEIHIVYVVPEIPVEFYRLPSMLRARDELCARAKAHLADIADFLAVPPSRLWVRYGKKDFEVLRLQAVLDIDTVVWSLAKFRAVNGQTLLRRALIWLKYGNNLHFKHSLTN